MTKTAHKSLFVAIFAAMIMMFALIGGSVQAAAADASINLTAPQEANVHIGAKDRLTFGLNAAGSSSKGAFDATSGIKFTSTGTGLTLNADNLSAAATSSTFAAATQTLTILNKAPAISGNVYLSTSGITDTGAYTLKATGTEGNLPTSLSSSVAFNVVAQYSASLSQGPVYPGQTATLTITQTGDATQATSFVVNASMADVTFSARNLGGANFDPTTNTVTIPAGTAAGKIELDVIIPANAVNTVAAGKNDITFTSAAGDAAGSILETQTVNAKVTPLLLSGSKAQTISLNDGQTPLSAVKPATIDADGVKSAITDSGLTGYTYSVASSNTNVLTADVKTQNEYAPEFTLYPTSAGTSQVTVSLLDTHQHVVATYTTPVTVNGSILVKSITVTNSKTPSIDYGKTWQINTYVSPQNASNKALTYESSKTNVATVSSTGLVTAVSAGQATITIKTADGGDATPATVTVTVKPLSATGVEVPEAGTLYVTSKAGASSYLTTTASVLPQGAAQQEVTWSLTNDKGVDLTTTGGSATFAIVNSKANPVQVSAAVATGTDLTKAIEAVNKAGVNLTVKVNGTKFTATQKVTVAAPVMNTLTLQSNNTNIPSAGLTVDWNAAGVPFNVVENKYTGATSDLSTTTWSVTEVTGKAAFASVNGAANTLVFSKPGSVKVVATAYGVSTQVATITMNAPALTGFTLNPTSTTIYKSVDTGAYPSSYKLSTNNFAINGVNYSANIIGTPVGSNAGSANYTFSSQNPSIAAVDNTIGSSKGTITAVKAGTTTIYVNATLSDGTALAPQTFEVTVVDKPVYPSSMTVTPNPVELSIGGNSADSTTTLTPAFTPATTTNQAVTYTSNLTNIATVDANGVVTAVAPGSAVITVTPKADTTLAVQVPVTVTKVVKPTALTIIPDTTSLAKGTSASLAVKATPTAADASVVWSSNNPAAVSVDEATGVVTANQMGSAIITATSTVDAAISDTAIVTVDQAVPGIDVIITGSTTANTLVPAVTGISKLADKDVTTYRFFTWSGEDQSDMQIKEVSAKSAVMNSVTTSFDATGFKAPAATYVDVYAITPNGDIFLGHTVYSELASGVLSAYGVAGNGHVQNIGWQQTDSMVNGGIIGTTGKALRLEAFKLVADPAKYNDVQFVYNVQYSDGTVSGPQTDGHMVGTVGQGKSITGVNIQIEGLNAADYTMTYDVHFANTGWKTGSVTDLTTSIGDQGYNQIEAIRITSFKAK